MLQIPVGLVLLFASRWFYLRSPALLVRLYGLSGIGKAAEPSASRIEISGPRFAGTFTFALGGVSCLWYGFAALG